MTEERNDDIYLSMKSKNKETGTEKNNPGPEGKKRGGTEKGGGMEKGGKENTEKGGGNGKGGGKHGKGGGKHVKRRGRKTQKKVGGRKTRKKGGEGKHGKINKTKFCIGVTCLNIAQNSLIRKLHWILSYEIYTGFP